MPKLGMRGTGDFSEGQRPGAFGSGIKRLKPNLGTRVTRDDVERAMREVHRNVPKNVKKTGKKGKAKEKMLRAIALSKARRG